MGDLFLEGYKYCGIMKTDGHEIVKDIGLVMSESNNEEFYFGKV